MPTGITWVVVSLLLCVGLSALCCANSVDVQVRASVAATQVLLPGVVAGGGGGGSIDETAAYSPRVCGSNLHLLTVDLSNVEWLPESGTSTFTLQTELVIVVRSNVPWVLSAKLETTVLFGKLGIRSGRELTVPLDASARTIGQGGLGAHELSLQLHASDGISQEELEAVSITLLLQAQ